MSRGKMLRVSVIPEDMRTYRVNPRTDSNIKEFSVDCGNDSFTSVDGVLCSYNQRLLVRYPPSRDGVFYYVPDEIKVIGIDAFSHVRALRHVILGPNVERIEARAFSSSIKLSRIEIGAKVKSIDASAFAFCCDLEAIEIDSHNPYFRSVNGCLLTYDYSTLVYVPARVQWIPDLSRCRYKTSCATSEWNGEGNQQLCTLELTAKNVVEPC